LSAIRAFILAGLVLYTNAQLRAQDVSPHAQEAVKIIQELRTMPLPDIDLNSSPPPAPVPGLLRRLNQELKSLIVDVLNDPHRDSLADVTMVYDELKKAGWGDIYRSRWNAYGEINNIDFTWLTNHVPPLLVVDTELWEPCGSDLYTTLYVFQQRRRNWDLVLTTDADYFSNVGKHPDDGMSYAVSSQDRDGKWFLGVATMFPDCRNSWSGDKREVRLKIVRPGTSPENPAVLLDRRVQIFDKFTTPFYFNSSEDKFSITVGKERRLDGGLGVSVFRFDVRENQVSRIAPIALQPGDFLDEWVRTDWSEVARWANPAKEAGLESWHAKLRNLAFDSVEIEFVQPCPVLGTEEHSWVLGLWIDPKQNRNSFDERLFVSISEKMGAYFVDAIGKARPVGCPGNTRPTLTLPDTDFPF
jgi:hypothetical protein